MAVQDPGRTTGFPCKQCGMVCPSIPSLLKHMNSYHQQEEERKFKCDECGRGYRHAGSLANHKKTHDVGSFQCNVCGKENSNALALKSHLRSHASQKKYSCALCGKSFRLATQLATHERVHFTKQVKEQSYRKVDTEYPTHKNDEPHRYSEQSSSLEVSTENGTAQSESSDDAVNRPFRCDLCDKSYIHHRSLSNHKKTHQVGMFECTVCFKLFNNMAALYSHQRSHKGKSGTDATNATIGSNRVTSLDKFSAQSQDAQVNFCHLCQILFPSEEEFQEHIRLHNSSSLSFGLQDSISANDSISYNSIASPDSNFYASPINNVPSVSSVDNYAAFDQPKDQIRSNSQVYSDCSSQQPQSCNSTQGEPTITATNSFSPTLTHTPNTDSMMELQETSAVDSDERPFKCQICGKSYRHSGSLINHKRSHQVGIYQCSVCRKSYPHLAALKSHLRLHKAQTSSYGLSTEGDWLSSEPLTLDNQQGCFSQGEEDGAYPVLSMDEENGTEHSNGTLYGDQLNQDFYQNMSVNLPQSGHLMQRHMCADCGETFADIAGIKSHSCPLLQQQHDTANSDYDSNVSFLDSDGQSAVRHPGNDVQFHGSHNQDYFEQNFQDNMNHDQLNGGGDDKCADEEDDDGDLYQCSICGNSYTSMRALRSHLRGHTQSRSTPPSSGPSSMSSQEEVKDEPGEMMICSTCGESFASRQDLINHQLLHSNDQVDNSNVSNMDASAFKEESQSIICGGCGIFCSSYHHLQNHSCTTEGGNESTKHPEDKMKVNNVIKTADSETRQYKCDQCGRSYRHAGSLLNHKKSHKTGVFRCLVCQKRFYNLLALKNHQRSHFDVKRSVPIIMLDVNMCKISTFSCKLVVLYN